MNLFRIYDAVERDGYPAEWHTLKHLVRAQAGDRCERCLHPYILGANKMERIDHPGGGYSYESWSPCDALCAHGGPIRELGWGDPFEAVLGPYSTVAEAIGASDGGRAFEARFRILTVHHLDQDKANCLWWNLVALCQRCHLTVQRRVVMDRAYIFEHSDWFKPYAAGYYAWKYLNEYLDRDETLARLDELLALERLA